MIHGPQRSDRDRVVEEVSRDEAAVEHPLQRKLLDRRGLLVGVEADVAEEHAVGVGHRVAPHGNRVGTVEAVRHHLEPGTQRPRAAARVVFFGTRCAFKPATEA